MNSLIIGADGLVGSALKRQLTGVSRVYLGVRNAIAPNRFFTDLTNYESLLKAFSDLRPSIVYLPAAITNVNQCENKKTNTTNLDGAITVLRLCEQFEAKLVYFSSSYVFDGRSKYPYSTDKTPNPIQNYGVQKLNVENAILKSDARFVIVRTVGVFGQEPTKRNFAKSVISSIFSGKMVMAPKDQFMNPILSDDLAKISIKLAEKHNGLFHIAGDRCVSKSEFAKILARNFGLEHLISPVSTSEMRQKALRPTMGCLDCSCLKDVGMEIPGFEKGILKFLTQEYNG